VANVLRLTAIAALVPLVGNGAAAGQDAAASSRTSIPLFSVHRSLTVERDMPPAVRARIEREQQRVLDLARSSAGEPASRANGCVPDDYGSLGPPAPRVSPRVLGYQVEVLVSFERLPRSLACRPWRLRVTVHSSDGKLNPDSAGGFYIHARRGRVVVDLAWFGKPPYRLKVYAESLAGRYGKAVEVRLRCPGTGAFARGCFAGTRGFGLPKPILPLRGVTRASLETSLDYLLSAQRRPPLLHAAPVSSECSALRACEVTYVDSLFPDSPFRIRYRIVGQQVRGCWLGRHQGFLDERPYEDAGGGPLSLAACASWVR
jgi:hypothetical protein